MFLIIRTTPKQAFSQGRRLPMKDSEERLNTWVEALNETTGWKKYATSVL